jgi:hypothetical protein
MGERERRIAENETRFREVNERLESAQASVGTGNTLALADYEAVRADPVAFLVKPGHEAPEAENLVERHGPYNIVRKQGEAAEIAHEHDTRDR